jgi:hypothetical protein
MPESAFLFVGVCVTVLGQDNVRFLHTVAQLNDVFLKQYHVEYPSPPVTWVR